MVASARTNDITSGRQPFWKTTPLGGQVHFENQEWVAQEELSIVDCWRVNWQLKNSKIATAALPVQLHKNKARWTLSLVLRAAGRKGGAVRNHAVQQMRFIL